MITNRDISRLKSGTMPYSLENQPFIIMREKVTMRLTENIGWQWSIMDAPEEKAAVIIDRKTASAIINHFKMEQAISNLDGCIWELPGSPFKLAYGKKSTSDQHKS